MHRWVNQLSWFFSEALDVVSVDSTRHSSQLFSGSDTTLKFQTGLHKIVVEYEVVTSEPLQISFSAVAGKPYYIKICTSASC